MTMPTQLVLRVLIEDQAREIYGLQLSAEVGLPSGTVHPILTRLQGVGWLTSRWEEIDCRKEGRPKRRYYRLNPDAIAHVQAALLRAELSAPALHRLHPAAVRDRDAQPRHL